LKQSGTAVQKSMLLIFISKT